MSAVATFSSMIDLAITKPEIGTVNFKLLRSFLHSVIQHLQLSDTTIKYDPTLPESSWNSDNIPIAGGQNIIQGQMDQQSGKTEMSKRSAGENLSGNEESRSSSWTPFSDISISKRVDACEESLKKLTISLEDLAQDTSSNSRKLYELGRKLSSLVPDFEGVEDLHMEGKKSEVEEGSKFPLKPHNVPSDSQQIGTDNKCTDILDEMQQSIIGMKDEMNDLASQQKYILSVTEMIPMESISELLNEMSELKVKMDRFSSKIADDGSDSDLEKISSLENQMREYSSRTNELNETLKDHLDVYNEQMLELEKELAIFNEKINTFTKSEVADVTSLGELHEIITQLQAEMEQLNEKSAILMADYEDREMNISGLMEQIEHIKIMKADKEALEDALTEKADALIVNRKVSHDQFDAAFEELNRSLVEAQAQLSQQERGWLNALEEIQKEIGSKIDKIEITPLKNMIENKMKNIQEKIQAMTAKRQELEALGTKKKLLRNLNCISCDKKVVMKTTLDRPLVPLADGLPPHRSMRPFLTYELDQVRQKHNGLPSRNLNHFESAVAEQWLSDGYSKGDQRRNHVCSRYCGGSHTIITNQQRVCRVGHFPEGVILSGRPLSRNESEGNIFQTNLKITKSPKSRHFQESLSERPQKGPGAKTPKLNNDFTHVTISATNDDTTASTAQANGSLNHSHLHPVTPVMSLKPSETGETIQ